MSIDLLEAGSTATDDQTAERVLRKNDKRKIGHRMRVGAGQTAETECIAERESSWRLAQFKSTLDSPNVGIDEDVRSYLQQELGENDASFEVFWSQLLPSDRKDLQHFDERVRKALEDEFSSVAAHDVFRFVDECQARGSRFLLGLNSTLHIQNINADFTVPQWRANAVAAVRLVRWGEEERMDRRARQERMRDRKEREASTAKIDARRSTAKSWTSKRLDAKSERKSKQAVRMSRRMDHEQRTTIPAWRLVWTNQFGINMHPVRATGESDRGPTVAGLDSRLTVQLPYVRPRLEGGARWPGDRYIPRYVAGGGP